MRRHSRLAGLLLATTLLIALATTVGLTAARVASAAGSSDAYLVLYKQEAIGPGAAALIRQAGGSIVAAYGKIGVAVVTSANPSFAADIDSADNSVQGAAATAAFATRLDDGELDGGGQARPAPSRPQRTGSASSASRRTSGSPQSRPRPPTDSSIPRPSSARSCGWPSITSR
jgi:hypothetical protein